MILLLMDTMKWKLEWLQSHLIILQSSCNTEHDYFLVLPFALVKYAGDWYFTLHNSYSWVIQNIGYRREWNPTTEIPWENSLEEYLGIFALQV